MYSDSLDVQCICLIYDTGSIYVIKLLFVYVMLILRMRLSFCFCWQFVMFCLSLSCQMELVFIFRVIVGLAMSNAKSIVETFHL